MMTDRHPTIERYWYSIDWDVPALWAMDLPVETLLMSELDWHLDVPVWAHDGKPYQLTPRQVIADPKTYQMEFDRMQRADLSFPIEVFFQQGRWMILDGVHRLLRNHLLGREAIKVRKAPAEAITRLTP